MLDTIEKDYNLNLLSTILVVLSLGMIGVCGREWAMLLS